MDDYETKANISDSGDDEKYNNLRQQISKLKDLIQQKITNMNTNVLSSTARQKQNANNLHSLNASPSWRVQRKLEGHFGKIYALHWSYGSCIDIVSASQDGKLLIWSTETSNKKIAIGLSSSWVMTCAYSFNNRLVISGGLDSICSVYDISSIPDGGWHSDKPHRELMEHEGYISAVKFVDNNRVLSSSGDGSCFLWDIEKASVLNTFQGESGDIECIDVNRKKSIFVSGSIDSIAKVWDYRQENKCIFTFKQHSGDINCIKFFVDGEAFASGADDNKIKLIDLKACQEINEYHNEMVRSGPISIDFSKSGYYLCAGYEDEEPFCIAWNTMTAQIEKELQHDMKVCAIQTQPNGYCIATGCWDKIIRIWA